MGVSAAGGTRSGPTTTGHSMARAPPGLMAASLLLLLLLLLCSATTAAPPQAAPLSPPGPPDPPPRLPGPGGLGGREPPGAPQPPRGPAADPGRIRTGLGGRGHLHRDPHGPALPLVAGGPLTPLKIGGVGGTPPRVFVSPPACVPSSIKAPALGVSGVFTGCLWGALEGSGGPSEGPGGLGGAFGVPIVALREQRGL
ncbi:PREDICTED: basic proline-rich protein-like [Lepidothrix coronata]|uniref:Basic proline-rich protein-like n=1 Tax=Lepidothrix coronata TaxID=321398 RepID=A0A6J0J8P2_9PASS|nr:PREDICTED: basic proline-rich protein-like [Lepidothrix coronata]